ncbi:hypothetical protein ACEZDB_01555 [Streptacidiphilus sp. N1-3]|uniref:Uncharacterized protein n=1 Tax=Streptacidiphilus alkalitolerans TaxID=3342712 RepID=A0ABV6WUP2_9ACTN
MAEAVEERARKAPPTARPLLVDADQGAFGRPEPNYRAAAGEPIRQARSLHSTGCVLHWDGRRLAYSETPSGRTHMVPVSGRSPRWSSSSAAVWRTGAGAICCSWTTGATATWEAAYVAEAAGIPLPPTTSARS